MRYLPHTESEISEMLGRVGLGSLDELFSTIPKAARFAQRLAVPDALDEPGLMRHLAELSKQNPASQMLSFLGAGSYAHHVPPAVDQLLLRSEFYTAYTPYQPEVAQGTLQAIWEFQTIVSELFGLPLSNASLYDGASATAEAAHMARRLTHRKKVLVSRSVHPDYRKATKTYLSGVGEKDYVELPHGESGGVDVDALTEHLDEHAAALVVAYPSFFGTLVDLRQIAERVHEKGALLITATAEPYALAIAESPGSLGADIAVGEGQPLACPPQFGGPGVGLLACREERKYLQQLPGRVCGETVDVHGERGYVLTLATREQHIRRERATSNICTNQGLMALALAIRASLLGKTGFIEIAKQCLAKAHYLYGAITELEGYAPAFPGVPFFNEFCMSVRGGDAKRVCERLEAEGILPGVDLGRFDENLREQLLIAVVETHSREDLDRLAVGLASI